MFDCWVWLLLCSWFWECIINTDYTDIGLKHYNLVPSLIRLNFFTRKAYVAIPHSIPIFPISLTLILASLAALAVLHWLYVTWGGHQQKQNFRLNKLYYGWSDFGMFCGVVFGIRLLSLSYIIGKSLLQKCGRIFRLSLKLN